jgi:hypothetical protein
MLGFLNTAWNFMLRNKNLITAMIIAVIWVFYDPSLQQHRYIHAGVFLLAVWVMSKYHHAVGIVGLLAYYNLHKQLIPENLDLMSMLKVNYVVRENCRDLKMKDLIDHFGSVEALQQKMRMAQVPYNLELNDDNAPLIGSYLMNEGIFIKTCNTDLQQQQNVTDRPGRQVRRGF